MASSRRAEYDSVARSAMGIPFRSDYLYQWLAMDAQRFMAVPRYAYSLDEAARSISISRRALYNLIVAGTVRTVKLGTRRVVPATELERLVRMQEQSA